jgi:cellulose synthase/poly-beta-1,6-N-acetylglucosamine synthase-like glycosyltransferase
MVSSDTIPEFISQRRRWLNGAFFAAVYSLVNVRQLWKTDHSVPRKILLQIEAFYQFLNLLFTYFGLVCNLVPLTEQALTIRRRTSTWLSFSLQDLYQTRRLTHSDTT